MMQVLKVADKESEQSPVPDSFFSWREQPIVFECEGSRLIGIVAVPVKPVKMGVVIVVGGPQYRAGSHRQFTLLARQLAQEGIASFRFDYRGMGDSEGDRRNFEVVDADIRAAIDAFLEQVPSVSTVIIWGLCDAASAALFYGHTDSRVGGLILLNPWVHSEQRAARVMIKNYYLNRILQRSFWASLFSGNVNLIASLSSATQLFRNAFMKAKQANITTTPTGLDFVQRMLIGFQKFQGDVLIVLSENDYTAQEFQELYTSCADWKTTVERPEVICSKIPFANHTFSSSKWRDEVSAMTVQWLHRFCH